MEGFFSKKEIESVNVRADGKVYSCTACGLYKTCKSPRMQPFGNFKKGIMVIGEAPGEVEDEKGKPWQGKTGRLLQSTLQNLGVDLFEDCVSINACHCRPTDKEGDNRTPSNYEIDCCRKSTIKEIERYKPKVILLLGGAAVYSIIGHRWKRDLDGITKWRGFQIPDQDFKAFICPTFHPSFVERAKDEPVIKIIWEKDLKEALICTTKMFPIYEEPHIEIIKDLDVLNDITEGVVIPDFETTGIKPHAPGQKVVCCAIADKWNHTFSFLIPERRSERLPLIKLFTNPKVKKWGHNIKFEQHWATIYFKQPIIGWEWDSMLAAHILDNRPKITNLKFQTYVNFGVVDYESDVAPFLKAVDSDSSNSLNRIMELVSKPEGAKALLTYCGYDTINELRLANVQRDIFQINDLPF